MKTEFRCLVFLLLFFVFCQASAQRASSYKSRISSGKSLSKYKKGSVGGRFRPYTFLTFNINALNYFGDLAPVNKAISTDVSLTRPGFGGHIGYKYSTYGSVRAGFNYGRIQADDVSSDPAPEGQGYSRYLRNLSFRNDIKEAHIGFEFDFIPNTGGPNARIPLNLYIFIGAAIYHHEPKGLVPELDHTTGGLNPAPRAGEWVKLRPLGTEGQFLEGSTVNEYKSLQFSVPAALGIRLRLPGPFDAGVEFGVRYLFTDYLDDVSDKYVRSDRFTDPLARIMADRSAEPISISGIERIGVRIANVTLDGVDYYAAGDLGASLEDGTKRGSPDFNDLIFITSFKLTYILQRTKKSAKFR